MLQQEAPPVIVRIIETPKDPTDGLYEVLLGALGVTGAIFVGAILMGLVTAGVLFWLRRQRDTE